MVLEEHGNFKRYSKGEVIFHRGDEGRHMYVVDSGHVEIVTDAPGGEVQLSILGPEDIFGEMAIFGGATRSATARALDDCGVREISRDAVFGIVRDPLARQLIRVMGERLREVDDRLAQVVDGAPIEAAEAVDLQMSRRRFG